jgi:hypothetical protein
MPLMMIIAVTAITRVERLGAATVGGLLPRRLGLAALAIPPLLAVAAGFAVGMATDRTVETQRTWTPASDRDSADIRRAREAVEFSCAYPQRDEVVLPDGSRLPTERWLTERAQRSAPTLDERQTAVLLARVIERDDHLRIDPTRLIVRDAAGDRHVSTVPARAEIDRAHLAWKLLQGAAALVIGAAVLANVVGTRGSQRRDRTWRSWVPFTLFLVIAITAFLWYVINPAVHVSMGDPLPLPDLSLWDEAVLRVVAHALAVGTGLGIAGAALVALAIRNAKWLPLVPDPRPRTV